MNDKFVHSQKDNFNENFNHSNKENEKEEEKEKFIYKESQFNNFKSLDDFKFNFDIDLLNPSKSYMTQDEIKFNSKKTAKDFFSSSSSADENSSNYKKSSNIIKEQKQNENRTPIKKKLSNSSISDFSSDNDKKKNFIDLFDKHKVKLSKKDKLDKYKIKNKFLLEDYKKYRDLDDMDTFYKKFNEIKEYSAEDIIKKFNKLKKKKKQIKFLEKFELKDIKFDKINLNFTIDLNKDKDLFLYSSLQMKDVPQFKRITMNKIIGLKNEKVSREILKDLNEMTGQYDREFDEEIKRKNLDLNNLRYFTKNIYTKSLLNEINNTNLIKKKEHINLHSGAEKKKDHFKEILNKKIESLLEKEEEIKYKSYKLKNIIETDFEDINLLESLNFEILFEKYFKNNFDSQSFLEENIKKAIDLNIIGNLDKDIMIDKFPTNKKAILSQNYISFNLSKNINNKEEKFYSVVSNINELSNKVEDPLSLDIDFSQISQNEKKYLLKNAEFNKKLNTDSENISLWLEYINYQDELFISNPNMFKNEKNKLEVKINIIEKALKIEKNKKNYILNILRLRILNNLNFDNFNQINLYWIIAFDNFYLEKNFLNEYLITLKKQPKLTISDLRDYYLALIKFYEIKLTKVEKEKKYIINKISKFIIDIVFDLISIDKSAGYKHRSFNLLRSLLELKILEHKNIINSKNTNFMMDYEEYFESGYPKLGDFENNRGFLDYKEKKIKLNKDIFLKGDFIYNIALIKHFNLNKENKFIKKKLTKKIFERLFSFDEINLIDNDELKNYILNQKMHLDYIIDDYMPLNPILDFERIKKEPENFLFYSDLKDFVEVKIKSNSEIIVYLISKTVSYIMGFEIDNEICFNCKKNFVYDFKKIENIEINNHIFFSKFYLIDNKGFKIIKDLQLLIYILRFFKYFEEMNINKKEIRILEMDFICMINHSNYKEKINFFENLNSFNEFPFTDINLYAKSIFRNKENQNDIDLWINYYDWLMIYKKFNEAEKVLKVINSKKQNDLNFRENLKIKFSIINHYFYSYLYSDEKKYNKKELLNLIFTSLALLSEGVIPENNSMFLDDSLINLDEDDFFLIYNKNYLNLISYFEKADQKLQKYLNVYDYKNNLNKTNSDSIFDEFDIENILQYLFILFLADFFIKYLKLQSNMYTLVKNNINVHNLFESFNKDKKDILIKSYMTHFKKIKIIEKFLRDKENFNIENETERFKIKKIHCSHFLSQEFTRYFYKFFYFISNFKNPTKCLREKIIHLSNEELNDENTNNIQQTIIAKDYDDLFYIHSSPNFNIKLLKLLNFSLDNNNDFFIFIICHFINQFENPLDREFSFINHFGENLNLKQSFYFVNTRFKKKFNFLKTFIDRNLECQENEYFERTKEFSKMQINISQILSLFKDLWKNSDFNSSRILRIYNLSLDEKKTKESNQENMFLINSPIKSYIFNIFWKLILDLLFNYLIYFSLYKEENEVCYISKFAEYVLYVNHEYSLDIKIFRDSMNKLLIMILILNKQILKKKTNNLEHSSNKGNKNKLETVLENLIDNFKNLFELIKTRELKN